MIVAVRHTLIASQGTGLAGGLLLIAIGAPLQVLPMLMALNLVMCVGGIAIAFLVASIIEAQD